MEFFKSAVNLKLKHSKLTAFDSTRREGVDVSVHIESTNGERVWGTVGVSANIIEASLQALIDSIEYFFYMESGDTVPELELTGASHMRL